MRPITMVRLSKTVKCPLCESNKLDMHSGGQVVD